MDNLQQNLIDDLTDIFGATNQADSDMADARDAHGSSGDASIRALGQRLVGINEDLTKDDVNDIAESVSEALSKGSATVKKSRKTEIKLCLEQRDHLSGVIEQLDDKIEARADDDKKINMRAAALASLRAIRDPKLPGIDNALSAVDAFVTKLDHVKDDEEKVGDLLDRLDKYESLRVTDDVGVSSPHESLQTLRAAILAAVGGDEQSALDKLLTPVSGEDTRSHVAAGPEAIPTVAAMDEFLEADPIEVETFTDEKIVVHEAPVVDEAFEEIDELDLEDLVKGLM